MTAATRRRREPPFPVQLAKLNAYRDRDMLAPGEYEARLEAMGPHGQRLARRLNATARVAR